MSINIWRDPWLVDEESHFATTKELVDLSYVNELIDNETREWKADLIVENFNESDSHCILSIPISLKSKSDDIRWAVSKNGNYSVKISYMLGKGCNLDAFHQAWLGIWSLEISPKVRHFFWRIYTNTLLVRKLLKIRHLIEDAACPWCHQEEETIGRAIFGRSCIKEL